MSVGQMSVGQKSWHHIICKFMMPLLNCRNQIGYKLSNGNSRANLESASTCQNGHFQKYATLARLADICQTLCEDSPDSTNLPKLHNTHQTHLLQVWRVLAKPFGEFGECRLYRFIHIKYVFCA